MVCSIQVRRRHADGHIYEPRWKLQKPGAVSHARFMAKAIYIMKMYMTRAQLPRNVVLPREQHQIERIAKFVFFVYAKYFLQSMVPLAAPRLDLEFWEDVHHFQVSSLCT